MGNSNLSKAKTEKNDEFYTLYEDIEKELQHYEGQLKGKVIYCNCDSTESNFHNYFMVNGKRLGIKGLIISNRDFRSPESIENLKKADIVITNPPFSLFREYVAQLIQCDKKFLVIGSMNAITYKEIFPLIKYNKLWLGHNPVKKFIQPDGTIKNFGNINWYTNLETTKRKEELILVNEYNKEDYPTYDNYDAINVDRVAKIPKDYYKTIGVPITFLDKWNPSQFEILDCCEPCIDVELLKNNPKFKPYKSRQCISNGKLCQKTYHRILIKRKGE